MLLFALSSQERIDGRSIEGETTMAPSSRIKAADDAAAALKHFYSISIYGKRRFDPGICDFTFGNPHEFPLQGLVDAIRGHAVPHNKNWYAYKSSESDGQEFLAERLGRELGLAFAPDDIALTTGAFAAIMIAIHQALEPGDEAIFSEPAWFCYEPMLRAAAAVPRKLKLKPPQYDLDLAAIDAAIGARTRLVIINSPHNPTGRIYGREILSDLAALLDRASTRIGHRIYLLSDEPYRRLRFDGRDFVSAASIYPWTFISYSYGKVLLAPGQRLGYLATSPLMPAAERRAVNDSMFGAQMALGWCFPNAVMQYAIPDLENLSIDQAALTRRRDTLLKVLKESGYAALPPEGTFYVWVKWPEGDPEHLWTELANRDVFVMPGRIMNSPGYFRISLTASDEMVQRSLPAFRELAR
jgi:aspartate aminotransferase